MEDESLGLGGFSRSSSASSMSRSSASAYAASLAANANGHGHANLNGTKTSSASAPHLGHRKVPSGLSRASEIYSGANEVGDDREKSALNDGVGANGMNGAGKAGVKRLRLVDVSRCTQVTSEMVQWLRMYVAEVRCSGNSSVGSTTSSRRERDNDDRRADGDDMGETAWGGRFVI